LTGRGCRAPWETGRRDALTTALHALHDETAQFIQSIRRSGEWGTVDDDAAYLASNVAGFVSGQPLLTRPRRENILTHPIARAGRKATQRSVAEVEVTRAPSSRPG
jgi:hypothetical protein